MLSKEAFWERAEKVSSVCPVIIRCPDDGWRAYFDEYTAIDAEGIGVYDLWGIDPETHEDFVPLWLKDAERTNTVVITHIGGLPPKAGDFYTLSQNSFAPLIRMKDEDDGTRELGFGSGKFVPKGLRVFLILGPDERLDRFYLSRCGVIDTDRDV